MTQSSVNICDRPFNICQRFISLHAFFVMFNTGVIVSQYRIDQTLLLVLVAFFITSCLRYLLLINSSYFFYVISDHTFDFCTVRKNLLRSYQCKCLIFSKNASAYNAQEVAAQLCVCEIVPNEASLDILNATRNFPDTKSIIRGHKCSDICSTDGTTNMDY